ncbi:MAG TPA: PAS domain S-box protein [Xanthobacteraceae bacterium]|jgi:PAS domain S-box-containing protein
MNWLRGAFWIAALLCLMTVSSPAAEPRRVLLLHAFGHPYSPWSDVAGSFRAELTRKSTEPIDLYEVSLDTARARTAEEETPFVEYIRALLSGRKLDLIVPIGAPAAFFMHRHRTQLFPATPMMVTGADLRRIPGAALTENDTAVVFDLDLRALVTNILQTRPKTTDLAVAVGNSPVERFWAAELEPVFQVFAAHLNIDWFNQLTFSEMLGRAAKMPPRSAILWTLVSKDVAGVPYMQDRALDAIRQVASVPVFGIGDYQLGRGIVGGPLLPTQAMGEQAAGVAIRILKGEKPADIRSPPLKFSVPTYDWRELRRWGISEALLPGGSVVQFREPSLWVQYRWPFALIAVTLVAQGLIIFYMVFQNRRLRAAESALNQSEERMTSTAASANVGLWQFDRRNGQLWATEHCRALFGLNKDAPLDRDTLLAAVHPDDRQSTVAWFRKASNLHPVGITEFRVRRSDGQVRWLRIRAHAAPHSQSKPDQLSGIFIDVTQQKAAQAEAAEQRQELAHLMRVSLLGELSGSIAHEVSQPLSAILSNAQAALYLAEQETPDLAELRDTLRTLCTTIIGPQKSSAVCAPCCKKARKNRSR